MKLACDETMFTGESLSAVTDTRLRFVEVSFDTLDIDGSAAAAMRGRCDEAGLGVASARVRGPLATESLTDVAPAVFASLEALEADTIVLPLVVSCDEAARRKRQIEVIGRLGNLAATHDLRLAIELHESDLPGTHLADARAMCRLAADVAHDQVGLALDTGRFMREHHTSSIDIALQRVLPWLMSLRLGDHSGTPGDERILPLGDGCVLDGCRVREVLATQRYAGPVVVAVDGDTGAGEALRTSVQYLRECGWRIDR